MIVLSANNLSKRYGVDVIIEKASFHVNAGDRIGIVGRNGAGKTTLMNLLTGELNLDEGEFFLSENTKIGYLKQRDSFDPERTVIEEIDGIYMELHRIEKEMEKIADQIQDGNVDARLIERQDALQQAYERKGGYTYQSEMYGVLNSMAFGPEFYDKKIMSLSGGERTRLALAALLLEKPDILLLDEPTNHLDIGTLKWLEQYLVTYKGTIMIVSHDRYFLDQTVNRIFEVSNHKVFCYDGNYSDFAVKKAMRRESDLRAYQNQQREIQRQEEMIRKMKQHGTEHLAKRAASREKRLDMIQILQKPEGEIGKMKIHFRQDFQSGNDVLKAENLGKEFGWGTNCKRLFQGVNLDIKRGEKICLVGPNGVGKTTLLRILMGELEASEGYLKVGHNVKFGYYDQGQLLLNNQNTVLEELKESYRLYSDTEMRNILGRFLFRGEEVFLPIGSLSGGEKARLSLLKLMLSGANTLILDEPTNHLDIESKEVFEEALLEFPGTVLVVSHDRYFLKKIPSRILELVPDGMNEYLGKYDYYLEKKNKAGSGKQYLSALGRTEDMTSLNEVKTPEVVQDAQQQRILNKEREAQERRNKRMLEKLESEISALEKQLQMIEDEMSKESNQMDYEQLTQLSRQHENLAKRLDETYDEWTSMQDE